MKSFSVDTCRRFWRLNRWTGLTNDQSEWTAPYPSRSSRSFIVFYTILNRSFNVVPAYFFFSNKLLLPFQRIGRFIRRYINKNSSIVRVIYLWRKVEGIFLATIFPSKLNFRVLRAIWWKKRGKTKDASKKKFLWWIWLHPEKGSKSWIEIHDNVAISSRCSRQIVRMNNALATFSTFAAPSRSLSVYHAITHRFTRARRWPTGYSHGEKRGKVGESCSRIIIYREELHLYTVNSSLWLSSKKRWTTRVYYLYTIVDPIHDFERRNWDQWKSRAIIIHTESVPQS